MIVAEYGKHRFSVITLKDKVSQSFGKQGSGEGQFYHPCTVAVDDDDDNILVVDGKNNRIQMFTPEGHFKACVGKSSPKCTCVTSIAFAFPVGTGIHPQTGKIYVTENHNNQVQILNSDLTPYKKFGTSGKDTKQFNEPKDLAFDSAGNVYIADNENHRIQVFTKEGVFLR